MANQDAWRKLRQKLVEQGLDVVLSKRSHYKVYRHGQMLTSLSSSSGGGRGFYNAKAQLKRLGIEV